MIDLRDYSKGDLYNLFSNGWKEDNAPYSRGFRKTVGRCTAYISPASVGFFRICIFKFDRNLIDSEVMRPEFRDWQRLEKQIRDGAARLRCVKTTEDAAERCCSDIL